MPTVTLATFILAPFDPVRRPKVLLAAVALPAISLTSVLAARTLVHRLRLVTRHASSMGGPIAAHARTIRPALESGTYRSRNSRTLKATTVMRAMPMRFLRRRRSSSSLAALTTNAMRTAMPKTSRSAANP